MNAVSFQNVVKTYAKNRALDGLDLEIPEGSIFGLVGSNGAGKTTIMSVAAGLVKHTSGQVNVLEQGSFRASTLSGRVTLLPQDSGLPYYARVDHLLYYYARLQGFPRRDAHRAVREVLADVNLSDREHVRVRSLSHGMMRRVTVAQAFLGNPDLVLLDEPMSGLDPVEVQNIRRLISSRRGRQTVVLSSHILTELQNLCDQVAIIENGRRQRQGPMHQLVRHSHHAVYHLGFPPDLPTLEETLPNVQFTWEGPTACLNITYPETEFTLDQLNARLLPVLLSAQCPVREIHQGSDLETEYLKGRESLQ